jgi:hypothetical protein
MHGHSTSQLSTNYRMSFRAMYFAIKLVKQLTIDYSSPITTTILKIQ